MPTISSSDKFTNVVLDVFGAEGYRVTSVYATTTGGVYVVMHMGDEGHSDPSNAEELTNLGVLRSIYLSSAGFLDGSDDAVVPLVNGYPFGNTLEALERDGIWNPLRISHRNQIAALRQVQGLTAKTQSVQTADGEQFIQTSAGLRPVSAVPDSAIDYPLDEIVASRWMTNTTLTIYAPSGVSYGNDFDGWLANAEFRALIQWLENHRVSGSAIFTGSIDDLTTIAAADLFNRNYTVEIGGNSWTFDIQVSSNSSNIFAVDFSHGSGTLPALSDVEAYLDTATVELSTTQADYRPPWGSTQVDTAARQVVFPSGNRFREVAGLPSWRIGGRETLIGGSYGSVLDWNGLEVPVGVTTYREIPAASAIYDVSLVHIADTDSTAVRNVRFKNPPNYIGTPYGDYRVEIHNGGVGEVRVQDWDGNELIRLYAGERIDFHVVMRQDGTGSLRSIRDAVRLLEVAAGNVGNMLGIGYWEFVPGSSGSWTRPLRWPIATARSVPLFLHADAFTLGTASLTDGALFNTSDIFVEGAFRVGRAGRLHVDLQSQIVGAGTGTLNSHSLVFQRQRGVAPGTKGQLYTSSLGNLAGTESRNMNMLYEEQQISEVQSEDVFLLHWVYAKANSKNPADVSLTDYRLVVNLSYPISVGYTPSA